GRQVPGDLRPGGVGGQGGAVVVPRGPAHGARGGDQPVPLLGGTARHHGAGPQVGQGEDGGRRRGGGLRPPASGRRRPQDRARRVPVGGGGSGPVDRCAVPLGWTAAAGGPDGRAACGVRSWRSAPSSCSDRWSTPTRRG